MRLQEKEKGISAKAEQLAELKERYLKEQDEKQKLAGLLEEQSLILSGSKKQASSAQQLADNLRAENEHKQGQIEKISRGHVELEDRTRLLEIRASEIERAELALESTRRNLETVQLDIRTKERELQELQEKYSEVCKKLENSCTKVQELEVKVEDLKLQVRCELKKNEAIERDTEMIPRLKDEIGERDKKINMLEKVIEEQSLLLSTSRKTSKEQKERLRELQNHEKEATRLREELDLTKNEVNTLKRLMWGKDVLVQQKCHLLDQAKMVVDALSVSSNKDERSRLMHIQQALDRLKNIQGQAAITRDNERAHEQTELGNVSKPRPFSVALGENDMKRSSHNHLRSSLRSSFLPKTSYNDSSITVSRTASCSRETSGSLVSSRKLRATSRLSAGQVDTILCSLIHNGDRVSATVEQSKPRYGRMKPSPITYTGIVKYKGPMDAPNNNDPRVYVGVALDAPIGDSDGVHQGIRYMFVSPGHAKFFKIQDLDSVFDISTGAYIPTSKLILCHQMLPDTEQKQEL